MKDKKSKSSTKAQKEPVRLREKKLTNGKLAYILIFTGMVNVNMNS